MKHFHTAAPGKAVFRFIAAALLPAVLALAFVEPNVKTFTAGEKTKVDGTIVSREGTVLKLRGDDDSIGTVELNPDTEIELKKGGFLFFKRTTDMNTDSLVSGLRVEVEGTGNDKGALVAKKVTFDPNSMKASKQIDTRISPLEARTGGIESRTGNLEGVTGKLEGRQGELETTQKQTAEEANRARMAAQKANQGVGSVNQRVSDIDKYKESLKETVYFPINSSKLSDEDKQKLDQIIQQTKSEQGYIVEVAGYADTTGNAALNQRLSQDRATSVTRYLEQMGDIPIHRILTPTGMGTSHEAADNSTREGRKMNRRVEVRVLINQGVVSSSASSTGTASDTPATPTAATTPPPNL